MRLKAAVLQNFRAYKGVVRIPLEDFTAVLGRNDVGKSSLLEAIGIFLEADGLKVEPADLCVRGTSAELRLGCVFDELPTELTIDATSQTTLEAEYLLNEDGNLEVHHIFEVKGGKLRDAGIVAVTNHPSEGGVKDLLQLKNTELKARAKERGVDTSEVDLRNNVQLRRAIRAQAGALPLARTEIPLNKDDAKLIWDQLEKELPIFALFKADRPSTDEDAEVQDPMKLAVKAALIEATNDLDAIKVKVQAKAIDVANRTLAKLRELDPGLASELKPDFKAEPKWDGIFKLSLASDDAIPLNKRGSGLRRLVLISFFRAEAERRQSEKGRKNVIYAVEEPEASQHPDNQKMLVEALLDLSTLPGCQVLITTHVPALAGLVPLQSVRHVEPDGSGGVVVHTGGDGVIERIADDLGILPDRRVAVLVCVEGTHDVRCLRHYSRILRADDPAVPDLTNDRRIAMLPMSGANLIDWVNEHYLKGLNLPEVHLYDKGSDATPKFATACDAVNGRNDGSAAMSTSKNELENYLHPEAISEVLLVTVVVTDDCDVPDLAARAVHGAASDSKPWHELTEDAIRKKHNRIKRRLNDEVAAAMTSARLADRGGLEELKGWLLEIGRHLQD